MSLLQKSPMESPTRTVPDSLAARLIGSNVNPKSLLATDYLNHFNEIFMMVEMIPDCPDLMEEIADWQPKTYIEHFEKSSIADKDLAIEAYEYAPASSRVPFDETVAFIDALILGTLDDLRSASAVPGNPDALRLLVEKFSKTIRGQLDHASGIINGHANSLDQSAIDALL